MAHLFTSKPMPAGEAQDETVPFAERSAYFDHVEVGGAARDGRVLVQMLDKEGRLVASLAMCPHEAMIIGTGMIKKAVLLTRTVADAPPKGGLH